jgi:hypothetical protein
MRIGSSKYEKARVPCLEKERKGTRAQSFAAEAEAPCGSGDHFFGGVVVVEDVDVVDVVEVVAGAAEVSVGAAVEVVDVEVVEVVVDGSVAGLLSLPPHAIARAASAERTMSFFMI